MFLNSWQQELDEVSGDLLTIPETAHYAGLAVAEVETLLERGRLREYIFKGYRFVSIGSLEQYLMQMRGKIMGSNPLKNPVENPFKGVNPILHTLFQLKDTGLTHKSFQTPYITHLSDTLNELLMGSPYFALTEDRVSIGGRDFYPDVVVKDNEDDETELEYSSGGIASPDLVIELPRIAVNVLIGRMQGDRIYPVTAIELLSPTNLDRTSRIDEFNAKHQQLLAHGLNVVTIHLLHIFPPTLEDIPRYPDDPDSTPYHLTVTRPQNISETGSYQTHVYRFGLDTPIPTIALPLIEEEKIVVSLDLPYQETFVKGRFNHQIDYAALSPNLLSKFREADRHYLEQRLTEISQMYA
jgi:hypothetical protein